MRTSVRAGGRVVAAAGVLACIVVATLAASILAPGDPRAITGLPVHSPDAAHPLGTNEVGQDLLAVWLHGGRISLLVGFLAALLSTATSGAVGMLSVTWRPARVPLLALTEVFLAIPGLLILVLILVITGPGTGRLILALALVGWPAFARIIRAQTLIAVRRDHVQAARALGATDVRIAWTCLLPEIAPLLFTKFLLTVRWAMLMEAALGLMGLGDPSRPSWGSMLGGAFSYPLLFLGDAWRWWALPPALAIAVTTVALSALTPGRATRAMADTPAMSEKREQRRQTVRARLPFAVRDEYSR